MSRITLKKSETRDMVKKLTGYELNEIIQLINDDMSNYVGKQYRNYNAKTYGGGTLIIDEIPVAIIICDLIIELGQYSRTTTKLVTTWSKEMGCRIYRINYKFDDLNGKGVF